MYIILISVAFMYSTAASGPNNPMDEIRCDHPRCVDEGQHYTFYFGRDPWHSFQVKDHKMKFRYSENILSVVCKNDYRPESPTLDSAALPRFHTEFIVRSVTLTACSPPATRPFAAVLARLNITLTAHGTLALLDLPQEPQLSAQHFIGLQHLGGLAIHNKESQEPLTPATGFLASLQNLRALILDDIRLPITELEHLPRKVKMLWFEGATREILPKSLSDTLSLLPTVMDLTVSVTKLWKVKSSESPQKKLSRYAWESSFTKKKNSLEHLRLSGWEDKHPAALQECDNLRTIDLQHPLVETLPERWIAACPKLCKVTIAHAYNLTSLPAKLFEGATALKFLSIKNCALQSLPDELFEGTPNLLEIDMSNNQLRTIPSGLFLGVKPTHVLLANNHLEIQAVEALASVRSLGMLNFQGNRAIGDLCKDHGYSPLVNLTQLRILILSHTNISRICRDWREDLIRLETLDLENTQIKELKPIDLLYTRGKYLRNDISVLFSYFTSFPRPVPSGTRNETELVTNDTVRFSMEYHVNGYCLGCEGGYLASFSADGLRV